MTSLHGATGARLDEVSPIAAAVRAVPFDLTVLSGLPTLAEQAERLIELGVPALAALSPSQVRGLAADAPGGLLVLAAAKPSDLAPLLRRQGLPGFVVVDMGDVDAFTPIVQSAPPAGPGHVVTDLDRGDALRDWSPDEAFPVLTAAGRTPLTLSEGLHWLLQQPDVLQRGSCFMTVGSRLRKADGSFDARTPALWISGGTGRDGKERKNASKVGWCWAGNRHTWLGFASAVDRRALSG